MPSPPDNPKPALGAVSLTASEQLLSLRDLTGRMGVLHEAQALQLRLWPFAVDPSLKRAEAHVDFEGRAIKYSWVSGGQKLDKPYRARLWELYDSVRFLLGDGWTLQVELDGKPIFPCDDPRKQRGLLARIFGR